MSAHRDVVDQLETWITQEVTGAGGWTVYKEDIFTPPVESPSLIIWWEGPVTDQASSTVATTGGWMGIFDTYGIRYMEPASDNGRLVVDEDRMVEIEDILSQLVAMVFNHRGDLPTPNTDLEFRTAAKFAGIPGLMLWRGCEVAARCRAPLVYA